MKRILITGKNSYIGTSFANFLASDSNYLIDFVETKSDEWKKIDFGQYDSIFDVAGIAHNSSNKKLKKLYYDVNTHLTIALATKAKKDGCPHFIYMSSMIVFGQSAKIGKNKTIQQGDLPNPSNFYGDSKYQAELGLKELEDQNFHVAIVRPPMVYGRNSKGNYPTLSKFARKFFIFPKINNCRSMIYIENLCNFIKLLIDNQDYGFFHPQNKEYINTSNLVKEISKVHQHKMHLTIIFNPLIYFCSLFIGLINKVFGNLSYSKEISSYKEDYCIVDFETSIKRTEEKL